jgi:deferrochelatase/peroxidase EfeB
VILCITVRAKQRKKLVQFMTQIAAKIITDATYKPAKSEGETQSVWCLKRRYLEIQIRGISSNSLDIPPFFIKNNPKKLSSSR